MTKYKKGKIIRGIVSGIESYGAFVKFDDFYTGLIHISEISDGFVKNIKDYLNVGDEIYAKIIDIDEEITHLKLSIKNMQYRPIRIKKHKKIIETKLGFKTLSYKLPKWIDKSLKDMNKKDYSDLNL